ncbi:hypothetical protein [Cryptosporangium japonicum]|uniref:Uncharacterized protein n=1 Tax=Cryptosporangium japonicum TaxID=80872 RepID=A0ABP3D433_9ACTN
MKSLAAKTQLIRAGIIVATFGLLGGVLAGIRWWNLRPTRPLSAEERRKRQDRSTRRSTDPMAGPAC